MNQGHIAGFRNKINEIISLEIAEESLYTLSVEQIYQLAEELAPLWQNYNIHNETQLKELFSSEEIKHTGRIMMKSIQILNDYKEALLYFHKVVQEKIREEEAFLSFPLFDSGDLESIYNEFTSKKNNILESIELLSSEKTASSLCKNYNEISLGDKLLSL